MCGHNPFVIITDDDKVMAKIAHVLPNIVHHLCMWHILQKVLEHLAHCEKWTNLCLRTMFCVGMSTTERRENMNKFFKDFVHYSTLVSKFVHQNKKALDRRYQKEK
ncbi:hypothetical protein ACSBR2_042367 [Camellia fascicularis]